MTEIQFVQQGALLLWQTKHIRVLLQGTGFPGPGHPGELAALEYSYPADYPSPRIIVHGKDYDRTYRFHYKEPKVDDNRYKLNSEEMDKKVKEVARRYLNDGYGSINLLGLFGK